MNNNCNNWMKFMHWQLAFYNKGPRKDRVDEEFDWAWLNSRQQLREKIRPFMRSLSDYIRQRTVLHRTVPYTQQWFDEKAELLWNSRQILEDELSRHLFDCYLLLIILGHHRYFFPRIDFENFITIQEELDYIGDLPNDYLGIPLRIFNVRLNSNQLTPEISILTTKMSIDLLNRYQQYLITREHFDLSPSAGEVVFDCGACIGEISLIFAALVGNTGEIHLFDPVPLHVRYCEFQAALNPTLSQTMHINNVAVSNRSHKSSGPVQDSKEISPSKRVVENYETTSLDDYVSNNKIIRVDYIKMDIEGSEVAALRGCSDIIRNLKPRLAISAYHKPDDLWVIPETIKKLNPKYKIYFGHHSPMNWESVYYAV